MTARAIAAVRRRWPRPETLLLLLALGWTIGAKIAAVLGYDTEHALGAIAAVVVADLAFFALAASAIALVHATAPAAVAGRAALLIAAAVLVWSMLNAAWLIATGVQLQPGVLGVLLYDPSAFVPVVIAHMRQRLAEAIPLGLTVVAASAWLAWRVVRPVRRRRSRREAGRRAALLAAGGAVLGLAATLGYPAHDLGYRGDVLGFNSHWYALRRTVRGNRGDADVVAAARSLPRAGERDVARPAGAPDPPPNIVVVLLESVSHESTSLAEPSLGTTPALRELAAQGVEFVSTRVPVALTSKAFWATFTGTVPDLQSDYAEAVLVDEPFESLATILGRNGYRSSFFQMSKGAFECAPGMFANLGFDWAWFFENLEDPDAAVGYLSADDFRMIEPAFEWVEQGPEPFLLTMITSVAHDPYVVPEWFDVPAEDRYARYLQAVRYTDAFVARIWDELTRRGLDERTILCVIGDHGEDFRDDFRASRFAPVEQVIRVPWIVVWPGHVPADLQIRWPCSQMDVTPTLLSLAGFDVASAGFDGINAMELTAADRRIPFAGWYPNSPRGFVEGDRKLVYWPYNGRLFQYDLRRDPLERDPVIVEGERRTAIIAEIEQWRRDSHFVIPATRFRERMLYDHWRTFSSGRSCWAYYVP